MNRLLVGNQLWIPFTVAQVMTPYDELFCWERGTDPEDRLVEASDRGFETLPVRQGASITGIVTVHDRREQSLNRDWLVSQDTDLVELLELFTKTEKPALLVLHGQDVIGLVTPADLNKLAMRVHVYGLIGRLEVALADFIGSHIDEFETDILPHLGEERQDELRSERERLVQESMEIGWIEHLYLSDLINVVLGHPDLVDLLGYPSKRQAKKALGGLNELRDQTMHLVRPLIQNKGEDLTTLQSRIARIEKTLKSLQEQEPDGQAGA